MIVLGWIYFSNFPININTALILSGGGGSVWWVRGNHSLKNLNRPMLEMINDIHEPCVNSISDQTFRFNYINWLLLGNGSLSGHSQSEFRLKFVLFLWILAMTWWWSDDSFVLFMTGSISKMSLYQSQNGPIPISWFFPDYIDTQNTSLRLHQHQNTFIKMSIRRLLRGS